MDLSSWRQGLWRKLRLRLRYEAIYLWPGWPALSAFNVGHAPARTSLLDHEAFRHQATNIEVYAGLADLLTSRIGTMAGKRILELGCGRGAGLTYLAMQGAEAFGIDNALAAVLVARRQGLRARWGDAGALPFAAQSLDAVIAVETVMLFGLSGRVLPQARRVLKPDGVLALAEFRPHGFEQGRREVIRLARDHGFRVATIVDRTEAARRAVLEDEPRRRAIYERLPTFARKEVADTLSLAGTPRYESWRTGRRSYLFTLLVPGADPDPRAASA